jgi:hypothetical protein
VNIAHPAERLPGEMHHPVEPGEVFHFFTHLDRGFPYTLKKLIVSPGTVQRDYIKVTGYAIKNCLPSSSSVLK